MGTNPTKIATALSLVLSFSAASIASMSLATSAYAETTDKIKPDETIVVIGRSEAAPINIAANVNVIDAAEIAMSGATDLTTLLRNHSGIQVADNGSGASFSMRGFTASQAANNTLILVDGRRLNNIDIASPSISSVPLNQIERVEILSGSAGVLYGDQAVGGVINIITKVPNGTGGGVQLSGGSFNTYEAKGDIAGAINDDWRYFLSGSYNQSDNYRHNNESDTGSILGRLQYQTATQDFFIEGSYYDDNRLVPGAISEDEFNDDPRASNNNDSQYTHEMTTSVRSGYQHQLNEQWAVNAEASYTDTLSTGNIWSPSRNLRSQFSFLPKAVAKYQLENGEMSLVTGLDLLIGEADFTSMGRSNKQTQYSAFVQATVPLTKTLSYVVGGRYAKAEDELVDIGVYPEGVDLDQDAHALELGLNYRPNQAHRLYIRADDNFRFAKVDEQAYTEKGTVGLKPQVGRSYEAGWDWNHKNSVTSINAYRLDLEDEIVWDPSAQKPDGGNFDGANVNADASRRYGVSGKYELTLAKSWLWGVEYNYIDAEFTQGENQGKALSWVAKHSGRSFVNYDFDEHVNVFVEGAYTGERFMEGDNANQGDKLDSYVLTNIAINYQRHAWQASLRVDNLFDEQYVSAGYYSDWGNGYYSGNGRSIRLTAGYRF